MAELEQQQAQQQPSMDAQGAQQAAQEPETITPIMQKAIDAMVAKRLKKLGVPEKEAADTFKAWNESRQQAQQQTAPEPDTGADLKARIAALESENAQYKNRAAVSAAGVVSTFTDFVAYEAAKLVNDDMDFSAALTKYLEKNPQYKAGQQPAAWGMNQGGEGQKLTGVEAAFYKLNPQLKR